MGISGSSYVVEHNIADLLAANAKKAIGATAEHDHLV